MKAMLALMTGSLVGLVCVGAWLHWRDKPVVQIGQDGTPTALIPRADLRVKDITPFVMSPAVTATVKRVTAEGRKVQVVAETRGTVRLDFGQQTVKQPVEAVAVMSTDKSGQPTTDLRVYTVQPDGTRQELPDAKTSIVAAQPQKPHWRIGLALQAGVGLTSDGTKGQAVAVIGLPWLRKGTGTAEGSTWALLTPALVTDGKSASPAVLVASWNAARHIPLLNDLWISPLVSFDVTTQQPQAGLCLTATF